jgi:1-acyl-sn-glycerol-3-phosphate acyltransferase
MRAIFSVIYWTWFVAVLVTLFPVSVVLWLVTRAFDPRGVVLHGFTSFWAWLYTAPNPAWRIEVRGREKLRRGQTYVIVANHQSLVDILVLYRLYFHFRWVSKIENFRIPLVGQVMRMNRYVPLVRGKRESVVQMMRRGDASLREGVSLLIFPEGTRSETSQMRPFKSGAFELARNARVPIVPVVVEGTARALPKHGIVLQGRHRIEIEVLDPIPPDDFKDLSGQELGQRVRELIDARLRELRGAGGPE